MVYTPGRSTKRSVSCSDTGTTAYQRDAAGDVVAMTDARGITTQITRDALGRPVQASRGAAHQTVYTWDTQQTGYLAKVEDASGSTTWERDAQGRVRAIREQRDCSPEEAAVNEVNPGLYAVRAGFLRSAIARLSDDNAQGELYLTDVVEQAAAAGGVVDVHWNMADLRGVNDRYELALCAEERRLRIATGLAREGVAVQDLRTLYVDADCRVEAGAVLSAQVHLRGRCVVEAGAHIDVVIAPEYLRAYSLAGDPADRRRWWLGVQREDPARGGRGQAARYQPQSWPLFCSCSQVSSGAKVLTRSTCSKVA